MFPRARDEVRCEVRVVRSDQQPTEKCRRGGYVHRIMNPPARIAAIGPGVAAPKKITSAMPISVRPSFKNRE